jgi:hypothetical protein
MATIDGYATDLPDAGGSGSVQFGTGGSNTFPGYYCQLDATQTPAPVTLYSMAPAVGSDLLATQPVVFELAVTPPATLNHAVNGRVIVWVLYPGLDGQTEVVYDGEKFTAAFDGQGKTEDTMSGPNLLRRRFTVVRNGGWPASPRLFIHANTDKGGLN